MQYTVQISPSTDYYIFRLLKDARWFANTDEVKETVHMWLYMEPKTFLADSIRKLVAQSNKCVEKLQYYAKKMTIYLFLCAFCRTKKVINCPYFFISPHTYRSTCAT